jgi:hypothetical protein
MSEDGGSEEFKKISAEDLAAFRKDPKSFLPGNNGPQKATAGDIKSLKDMIQPENKAGSEGDDREEQDASNIPPEQLAVFRSLQGKKT